MGAEIERLAKSVADYFRNMPYESSTAEMSGAVGASSPTALDYIDVRYTDCTEIVRAILTALREPSEGMLRAYDAETGCYTGFWADDSAEIKQGFQAMIDHILNEDQG